MRITAVRRRRVGLPDGQTLEQTAESPPSAPSPPLRTLAAAAEIARLQAANHALAAENERLPGLSAYISALEEGAAELGEQLAGSVGTVARQDEELRVRG